MVPGKLIRYLNAQEKAITDRYRQQLVQAERKAAESRQILSDLAIVMAGRPCILAEDGIYELEADGSERRTDLTVE